MEIIRLKSAENRNKKKIRSKNLENNKGAYNKLKQMMVPNEMKLSIFRKFYHPVLSTHEKQILLKMKMNPWSLEGLKYVGDCKRYGVKLGGEINI